MMVRYTDPTYGDEIMLRTKKFSIIMQKYKWVDLPEEIVADLKMEYKFLIDDISTVTFPVNYFKGKDKNIAFRRTFALGDLLMFVPIINYLNRTSKNKYTLITQKHFIPIFKSFNLFYDVVNVFDYDRKNYDKIIYLDGVLERDHSITNSERNIHRTKLYAKFLNLKIRKYDWNVK